MCVGIFQAIKLLAKSFIFQCKKNDHMQQCNFQFLINFMFMYLKIKRGRYEEEKKKKKKERALKN